MAEMAKMAAANKRAYREVVVLSTSFFFFSKIYLVVPHRRDAATGRELATLEGLRNNTSALAFSRDGRQLAAGCHDGTILTWDTNTGRHATSLLPAHGPVRRGGE